MQSLAFHWCCYACQTLVTLWQARSGTWQCSKYNHFIYSNSFNSTCFNHCLWYRFIYWRVCCFVCTREPKRRPRRPDFQRSISYHHQSNSRPISQYQPTRFANRASMRRSVRVSQRTADSGIDTFYEPRLSHAFSDTELRSVCLYIYN